MVTQLKPHAYTPAVQLTVPDILEALDATWERLEALLPQLGPVLDAGPDANGWTPRQVLSHVVGAMQRIPVHASFFLSDFSGVVPVLTDDTFWQPEWETAPIEAFLAAAQAAYSGNWLFVHGLRHESLAARRMTPFGELQMGELLLISITGHIRDVHIPQLEAFLDAHRGRLAA